MLKNFLIFSAILVLAIESETCRKSDPTVRTKNGSFCGTRLNIKNISNATVDAYLGIRYAKPPLGNLRFKKPEPFVHPTSDAIPAKKYGPTCFQVKDTMYQKAAAARMWVPDNEINEDCLYLNVWVPQNKTAEKLAVMVWIYGGGFNTGTSSLKIYDGKYFAAHQNLIVVSMNYRLGMLGFLYLSDDTIKGNMGLWDQWLALKWVKTNIHHFNGDSERITIVGESAGAVSTNAHVLSPWSQNLFRNAIMQSGSAFNYWGLMNLNTAEITSNEYLDFLNCRSPNKKEQMDCVMGKSIDEIRNASNNIVHTDQYFTVLLGPTLSTEFLPYSSNNIHKLEYMKPSGSLMFGINKNEASYFLLYAFITDADFRHNLEMLPVKDLEDFKKKLILVLDLTKQSPKLQEIFHEFMMIEYRDYSKQATNETYTEMLENIGSDRTFKCSTIDMANQIASLKNLPVYFYEFRYRTKSLDMPKWLGTMHGYEIEYIFGMPFSEEFQRRFYTFNDEERLISESMMTYWGNFVRNGDPNISPNESHVMENKMKQERSSFNFFGTTRKLDPINYHMTTSAPTYFSREPRVPMRDGDPKYGAAFDKITFKSWPQFKNTTQDYIIFDENGDKSVASQPYKRRCAFWTQMITSLIRDPLDTCSAELPRTVRNIEKPTVFAGNVESKPMSIFNSSQMQLPSIVFKP